MEKYDHLDPIKISDYISQDDPDIKAINYCYDKIAARCCDCCSELDIEIWDIFFDYFFKKLQRRSLEGEVDPKVPAQYKHDHNGLELAHCYWNEDLKKLKELEGINLH